MRLVKIKTSPGMGTRFMEDDDNQWRVCKWYKITTDELFATIYNDTTKVTKPIKMGISERELYEQIFLPAKKEIQAAEQEWK